MTPNEMEVLRELIAFERTEGTEKGARPLDLGGSSGSHHSQTAKRMVAKRWAERTFGMGWGEPKGNLERGSCRYRTTQAGRDAYENALESARVAARLAKRRKGAADAQPG